MSLLIDDIRFDSRVWPRYTNLFDDADPQQTAAAVYRMEPTLKVHDPGSFQVVFELAEAEVDFSLVDGQLVLERPNKAPVQDPGWSATVQGKQCTVTWQPTNEAPETQVLRIPCQRGAESLALFLGLIRPPQESARDTGEPRPSEVYHPPYQLTLEPSAPGSHELIYPVYQQSARAQLPSGLAFEPAFRVAPGELVQFQITLDADAPDTFARQTVGQDEVPVTLYKSQGVVQESPFLRPTLREDGGKTCVVTWNHPAEFPGPSEDFLAFNLALEKPSTQILERRRRVDPMMIEDPFLPPPPPPGGGS